MTVSFNVVPNKGIVLIGKKKKPYKYLKFKGEK